MELGKILDRRLATVNAHDVDHEPGNAVERNDLSLLSFLSQLGQQFCRYFFRGVEIIWARIVREIFTGIERGVPGFRSPNVAQPDLVLLAEFRNALDVAGVWRIENDAAKIAGDLDRKST